MKKILTILLVLTLVFSVTACSDDSTTDEGDSVEYNADGTTKTGIEGTTEDSNASVSDDTVIAVVNGSNVNLSDFISMYQSQKANYQQAYPDTDWSADSGDGTTYEESFRNMIMESCLINEVLYTNSIAEGNEIEQDDIDAKYDSIKANFDDDAAFQTALEENGTSEEELRVDVEKSLLIEKYIDEKKTPIDEYQPTDEEMQTKYIANSETYNTVSASHILVDTEEEALEVRLKAIKGDETFEDLAKEYSTGPSAENGGDLGEFTYDKMVSEFSDAAFALEVGEISQPVKTQYGYHIIKLTAKNTDYESVNHDNIIADIRTMKYQSMINDLVSEADIQMTELGDEETEESTDETTENSTENNTEESTDNSDGE